MVRKSSHRGVHSGNTLRASNSRYSRRYFHQSCIISRVGRNVLKKLLGVKNTTADDTARLPSSDAPLTKADDKIGHPQNVPIDVALSLNKQARWLLPSVLKHDISSRSFADPDLTVSLLERHKLKRHANCVSYCSNAGAIQKIQPYRGHYFSFAHPLPNGLSRRAMKREMRTQAQKKVSDRRIKHVFTTNGPVYDPHIGDSEVRYEVFYPCPQQSSLSHNPKYIKQHESVPPGDKDEKLENGKPRRKHRCKQRKRFTLKDYDEEVPPKDFDSDSENEDLWTSDSAVRQPVDIKELFLDILIDKAERAKQHLFENKRRRQKKSEPRDVQDTKPHLHYISSSDDFHNTVKPEPVSELFKPIAVESTRVIFPSSDVSVSTLAECFGQRYYEAACRPRKFVLDITSHVKDLMKKKGIYPSVTDCNEKVLTFLVFTFDGFYDNGLEVYKVSLNCQLRPGLIALQGDASQQKLDVSTTESVISQAMDVVEACVMELKKAGGFPQFCQTPPGLSVRCLKQHLGDTQSYFPSLQQAFQQGSKVTDPYIPSLEENIDEDPAFCDICYEEVSCLVMGGAAATALAKCGHRVCDACWALHVQTRIKQGFVRITCPGYDCQAEVDVGVLLSVVPVDVVSKIVQRQEEIRIGASQTEKWCPNEGCGRVLRFIPHGLSDQLDEKVLQQDVVCACGCHVCFMCLSAPHWPASCRQARSYREALATDAFRSHNELDDEKDSKGTTHKEPNGENMVIVKGKLCPGCSNFVEKNGGCNLVVCRCGLSFCFYCLNAGSAHHGFSNCIDKKEEDKLTTTVAVHHFNSHLTERNDKKQKQTSRHRSRVSLTGRAAEFRSHRLTRQLDTPIMVSVAKAVAIAAHKNHTISELVLQACRPASEDKISPAPQDFHSTDIPLSSLSATVRTFLKNMEQSKQEILEVVEYTLVFARDEQDSILRRRALRIAEDLGTFCSFTQSIMDTFCKGPADAGHQETVKAVLRLGEIQHWTQVTLASLIKTIRRLRTEADVNLVS